MALFEEGAVARGIGGGRALAKGKAKGISESLEKQGKAMQI